MYTILNLNGKVYNTLVLVKFVHRHWFRSLVYALTHSTCLINYVDPVIWALEDVSDIPEKDFHRVLKVIPLHGINPTAVYAGGCKHILNYILPSSNTLFGILVIRYPGLAMKYRSEPKLSRDYRNSAGDSYTILASQHYHHKLVTVL